MTRQLSSRSHRNSAIMVLFLATVLLVPLAGGAAAAEAQHRRGGYSDRDHRGHGDRHRRHDARHDRKRHGAKHDRHRYRDRGHQYRKHDRHRDRGHRYGRQGRHHPRFVAPRNLQRRHWGRYKQYYHGQVFFQPHGHYHRVYHFPVIVNGYTAYQPYAYCGDAYYGDHYPGGSLHYHGPRFGLDIRF